MDIYEHIAQMKPLIAQRDWEHRGRCYAAIESVYEDVDGRPVVLLKDPLPPDAPDGQRHGFTTEGYR